MLEDVPADAKVMCEEVFETMLALQRVSGTDEAFGLVNASRCRLQAGSSPTTSARRSGRTASRSAGSWSATCRARADQMPYGGAKDSGVGREGSATRWRT